MSADFGLHCPPGSRIVRFNTGKDCDATQGAGLPDLPEAGRLTARWVLYLDASSNSRLIKLLCLKETH